MPADSCPAPTRTDAPVHPRCSKLASMPNSSRSTCRALLSDGDTRCRGRLARSAHACSLHVEAHDASYERYKTAAEVALRLRPHMQIKRSEVHSLPSGSLNTRMEGVRAYMKAVRREMELREEHDRRFVGTRKLCFVATGTR